MAAEIPAPGHDRPAPDSPTLRASLLSLSPAETEQRVVALGGRRFHARIVRRAVLEQGQLDYAALSSLPGSLRAALAEQLPILGGRELSVHEARDGTRKLLIEFTREDSQEDSARTARVETVFMPRSGPDAARGATLCVSTQVGCPVGCPFCASGLNGLARNLAGWEILEQFVRGRALGKLARCVVMGIGEPLLNYSNLSWALERVHDEMGLGARKLTVSTVGFPERVARVARSQPRFQLAISLHTPDDEQRQRLVPAMSATPIEEVLAAGDDWFAVTGREVTYEYVLLGGENDSPAHAERLARRLAGRRCTVNLIPYNPVAECDYLRPEQRTVEAFQACLTRSGTVATLRRPRGLESQAACGQLRIASAQSR